MCIEIIQQHINIILNSIYVAIIFGYIAKIYFEKKWKDNKNILFISLIKVSCFGIIFLPLILIINKNSSSFGPLFILFASVLVFSLQSYFNNIEKREAKIIENSQKNNFLKNIIYSLKEDATYKFHFLEKYSPDEHYNDFGSLTVDSILTEDLYNYCMKLGFEIKKMDYLVAIFQLSKRINNEIFHLKKNYLKLKEKRKYDKIKNVNLRIYVNYVNYIVNIYELDELQEKGTENIVKKVGTLLDKKTEKECLNIIKEKELIEKLKKYSQSNDLKDLN